MLSERHRDPGLGGDDVKRELEQFPDDAEREHHHKDEHKREARWDLDLIAVEVNRSQRRVSCAGDQRRRESVREVIPPRDQRIEPCRSKRVEEHRRRNPHAKPWIGGNVVVAFKQRRNERDEQTDPTISDRLRLAEHHAVANDSDQENLHHPRNPPLRPKRRVIPGGALNTHRRTTHPITRRKYASRRRKYASKRIPATSPASVT